MSGKEELKREIEEKKRKLAELKAKREARRAGGGRAKRAPRAAGGSRSPRRRPGARGARGASDVLGSVAALTGGASVRKAELSMDEMTSTVNIAPAEKNYYDKLVQCDIDGDNKKRSAGDSKTLGEREEELRQDREKMNRLKAQLMADRQKYDQTENKDEETQEISPEDLATHENSKDFKSFLASSSKMSGNALKYSNYDITIDYTASDDTLESKEELVICRHTLKDLRTVNRAVTSICWNPNDGERMLTSYSGQDDPMTLEPDGTVLLWNSNLPNQPEQYFSCNSTVLTAQYHPTNPSWILGGCRSGQVVIWDMREKRSSPKIRTSLSHGHTYPVYALDCVPIASGVNNIVSVSTDGMMCSWSDDNLHDPVQALALNEMKNSDQKDSQEEITTTSFNFPGNAPGDLVLGSDEGNLYKAKTTDEKGIYKTIEKAHDAPITNVRFHPVVDGAPAYMNNLFLTSSYDWTVKLWNTQTSKLVYTFESARDYVFDVQWSPVHPAVFATGDGTGKLDVWNISGEADVPAYSVPVEKDKGAISRLQWSADGKFIAAGLSTGSVYVLEVKGDLSEKMSSEAEENFYTSMKKKATAV